MVYCSICGAQLAEGSHCTNCVNSPTPLGQAAQSNQMPAANNTLAIVALATSLAGTVTYGLGGIAGIICGHIALSQIKKTRANGRGMALAGVIIGYSTIALGILAIVALNYWISLAPGFPDHTDDY